MNITKRILGVSFILLNILFIAGTALSAYGGMFPPSLFKSIPAIASLAFPFFIVLFPIILIISVFVSKKMMAVNIATMILCSGAFFNFYPMNILENTPPEGSREIKIMTYNVHHYSNFNTSFPTDSSLIISAITESGADIVCIQEGVLPHKLSRKRTYATDSQLNRLDSIYPYQLSDTEGISTFSKFPITMLQSPDIPGKSGNLQVFQYDIDGTKLNIYNTHLQSFNFTPDDKELYLELTKGNTENNIRRSKVQLFSKLHKAFYHHETQSQIIRNALDKDTLNNIIVCGDFNDIPGCYAVRTICGDDMYDAYKECAFWYFSTYRDNRFYFHIDHFLCSNNITTTSLKLQKTGASDHYPVMATVHLLP